MSDPNIIQYGEKFYLRHQQTRQYICTVYSGSRYYFPKLGKRGKAKLQLRGGRGLLKHNDSIKIRSLEEVLGKNDFLGAFGDSHNCYYWKNNYDYDKQHWIISKMQDTDDNIIRFGDRVRITNVSYRDQRLMLDPNDPNFITTESGSHDIWILEPTVARPAAKVKNPRPVAKVAAPIKPEKAIETIPEEEAEQIKKMVDFTLLGLKKTYPAPKKILRGVHPKAHGCVKAIFEVNTDIAKELQIGLFANPGKTCEAWIRYSNATGQLGPDGSKGKHNSIGMALKILDVGGSVLLDDNMANNQDFLMITEPAFVFANVTDYLGFFQGKLFPPQPDATTEELQRIKRSGELKNQIDNKPVANVLEVQYFSAAPFLFGSDRVMKVSAKPCAGLKAQVVPENPSENYLREALLENMSHEEDVCFDFMVQVRGTDEEDLGIENASTEWDEQQFPFIKVAKITIQTSQQNIDTPDAIDHCEKLSYSPWHSLEEHRPLGGINRLRKAVYIASHKYRTSKTD